jgi:hypothetical protein
MDPIDPWDRLGWVQDEVLGLNDYLRCARSVGLRWTRITQKNTLINLDRVRTKSKPRADRLSSRSHITSSGTHCSTVTRPNPRSFYDTFSYLESMVRKMPKLELTSTRMWEILPTRTTSNQTRLGCQYGYQESIKDRGSSSTHYRNPL